MEGGDLSMSSIDERVVHMQFDNAQFERGVKSTLSSLEALQKSLKLDGAAKGLTDIDAAGKKVNLDHVANQADHVSSRIHAMTVVAISALATIASQATSAGASIVKSLTIEPLVGGLKEYELNLNSIQTILANTGAAKVTLEQVTEALDKLNHYADMTIYSFSEMAKNIGTFTAAGVDLETSVGAIKGIANLAALSGSNSQQAATAMYQLSQAISTGTVKLIDWNSVVNAGMGGTVFQRALAQTAVVMGKLSSSAVTLSGDMKTVKINGDAFRDSLEKGWLTADVLTKTLEQFTGDLSDAELAALGFSKTQIEEIQKQAATAKAAATEVKTMSQLLGALRESAGSGWAQTWQLIFGNFTEAKQLWSGVYKVLDGIIGGSADARNQLLKDWKALGGRDALIEGVTNIFKAIATATAPIREAFRNIFPATTGKQLADITKSFRDFTQNLMPSKTTLQQIGRIATGVFSIFDIGIQVVTGIVKVFASLLGLSFKGSGGLLEFLADIADFFTGLRNGLKDGDKLGQMFGNLARVLALPIALLKILGDLLGKIFGNIDTTKAAKSITDFVGKASPLGHLADIATSAWGKVLSIFSKVWQVMQPLAQRFSEWFHSISDAVGGLNFDSLLNLVNTGAFAGLVLLFHNLTRGGGASDVLENLTESLGAMQNALNAATLLQIALAVGVLAASAAVLSSVDGAALAKALSAISVMFAQLMAAMFVMTKMPDTNVVKLYVAAAALTVMGIAVNLLALAVKQLADLSWQELLKGLVGTTVLLAALVAAANFMPDGAKLISTGVGLVILAAAVKILASAVTDLSGLSWDEMARGLVGVGALLAALSLFTRFSQANATGVLGAVGIVLLAAGIKILASAVKDIAGISWENVGKGMAVLATSLALMGAALYLIPPTAPVTALGIVLVAASMLILAKAMQQMSGISWENVGKGMTIIAGALLLIGAALTLIPPTAPLSAAGVLIVALAVKILGEAIAEMGKMDWGQIARGLVTLGVSLALITASLMLLPSALPGAFALLIVSGALLVLSNVLKTLGGMSWGEIVKGLVALAGVFVVLGVAGALLGPVVPTLLGLGAAIALIGLGLALAGAGVFLFAAGLTALSVSGVAATAAIVAILSGIIGLIPEFAKQIGAGLLIIIGAISAATPAIVDLIIKLIEQLLTAFEGLLPKAQTFTIKLIAVILAILVESVPKMYRAGLQILIGVLEGIRDNIQRIVTIAGQIITRFINGISNELPSIIDAGVRLILSFIRGLTNAINNHSSEMGKAGADLALAIIRGMTNGLYSGVGRVIDAAKSVAQSALDSALRTLGIKSPSREFMKIGQYSSEGFAIGLEQYGAYVEKSAEAVGESAIEALRGSLIHLSTLVAENIDATPTITPVLDLSVVEKSTGQLQSLMDMKPLAVTTAYTSARQAETGYQNNRDSADDSDISGGNTYEFNQYNTSPKALSAAEIYRNSKNLLSTAKGGLPE